jgi:hypothetical protein
LHDIDLFRGFWITRIYRVLIDLSTGQITVSACWRRGIRRASETEKILAISVRQFQSELSALFQLQGSSFGNQ